MFLAEVFIFFSNIFPKSCVCLHDHPDYIVHTVHFHSITHFTVKKLYCIINKKCAFCWFNKCVMITQVFQSYTPASHGNNTHCSLTSTLFSFFTLDLFKSNSAPSICLQTGQQSCRPQSGQSSG